MSAQITITLSDDVLRRAEALARRTGRPTPDVVAEAAELSLRPLGVVPVPDRPVAAWSDAEVIAAADLDMTEDDNQRFSELLYRQQAGTLTPADAAELAGRMEQYQEGLLRKAEGIAEAVRRGLRPPPAP
jgi:hypothetical protein